MERNESQERIAGLRAIGGGLWERGNMRRVYMNDLAGLYGLRVSRYNTGNTSSATVNGEPISNRRANYLTNTFRVAKLWWDISAGEWASRDLGPLEQNAIIAAIEAKLAAGQTEATTTPTVTSATVRCACGHTVPRGQVMNASLGTACPECYDRMSA